MKKVFLTKFFVSKKLKLQSYLLLITLVFFQVSFADGLKDHTDKNMTNQQSIQNPMVNGRDKLCVCDCVNGKWVCTPKSENCGGVAACDGKTLNTDRDINSQVRPNAVNPTRQLDPKKLPGDQFDPEKLPGDQFKN